MFEKTRAYLARLIAPPRRQQVRMYQSARPSGLTGGWASIQSSADAELASSLTQLRGTSRALVRDSAYAKRAKQIIQNNVIGTGIGMQAHVVSTRDVLREPVNDSIESAWYDWMRAQTCHTGGTLHFWDLERALIGEVYEAGEVFIRKHYRPFGGSAVPFALEMIEAERIVDERQFMQPLGTPIRMGIELDPYGRPVAYYIRTRHPGEPSSMMLETDRIERVPAEQMIHLRLVNRWPQTRGEPWLHAVARKLADMDGYSEAEIVAARGAAAYMGVIESPDLNTPLAQSSDVTGTQEFNAEPGLFKRTFPGEKIIFNNPNRPNPALDPFMRYMLREVAAGVGVSYESLSRDYSQSNYSSSRLALLDDRDLWRCLQQWFIRSFRDNVHREWLRQAVFAGAVPAVPVTEYVADPVKFEQVMFKPRGWSWIDPVKEVEAFAQAVREGFTTVTDVIAATGDGDDLEDKLKKRRRELDMMEAEKLVFQTSPEFYMAEVEPDPPPAAPPPESETTDDPPERVFSFPEAKWTAKRS